MKRLTLTEKEVFVYSKKTGANLVFKKAKNGGVIVSFQDLNIRLVKDRDGYRLDTESEIS